MYPTLIIILVALDRSHCQDNFSYKGEENPPLRIVQSQGVLPIRIGTEEINSNTHDSVAWTISSLSEVQYKARVESDVE